MRLNFLLEQLFMAYERGVSKVNPYETDLQILYINNRGKGAMAFGTSHDEHIRQMIVSSTDIVKRWAVWSDDSGIMVDLERLRKE